ncbi:MAG TPA: LPS export ABC transporter ATP-binding protein [Chitinophagaceae bacterium]|jgi:lipopolysaccharide export system ATP-binding protein|nr:LPS export ABC transporter ATP-binding protein [Chitinophagaceae bacterium]
MPVTIRTQDLVKKYGSRVVVNHVSFDVKQGEIVGLLGPNGAGKTTSFYQVVGLVRPDEGKVFLNDLDITSLPMYKRAQMGIGYLPQEASVFRKLSVEDNIAAILEMTKLSKQQQKDKLESLLNEFRLQHVRKSNGDVLSGGERRRTEIARALSVDPKFILLDEPFAGIDPIAVEDIQAIVAKLKHKNIGILITDHNVTETLSICDRAYLLIEGKIFKHGTAEELAQDEDVRRLYLGRNFELRRKDYLHEEALADHKSTQSPDNFDTVIHKLIQETEKKVQLLSKIGVYKFNLALTSDLDMSTYITYLGEVRSAILKKYPAGTEIGDLAIKLPNLQMEDYQKRFSVYDMVVMPVFVSTFIVIGTLGMIAIYIVYSPLFKQLRIQLSDTRSLLSQIQLMIHAQNS